MKLLGTGQSLLAELYVRRLQVATLYLAGKRAVNLMHSKLVLFASKDMLP